MHRSRSNIVVRKTVRKEGLGMSGLFSPGLWVDSSEAFDWPLFPRSIQRGVLNASNQRRRENMSKEKIDAVMAKKQQRTL